MSMLCAKLLQSCLSLRSPMDCSPPGFSIHGIFQARVPECVAIPFSRGLPDPGMEPVLLRSPALANRFFTTSATYVSLFKVPPIINSLNPDNNLGARSLSRLTSGESEAPCT